MSRIYEHKRVRGMAPWHPQKRTLVLLDQVMSVLDRHAEYLPMTLRQIFYALVVMYDFQKTEQAYERLCEHMNRARRSRSVEVEQLLLLGRPLNFLLRLRRLLEGARDV